MIRYYSVLIVLLFCSFVYGGNDFIAAGDGTRWSDPANWSLGAIPTSADYAYIGVADVQTDYSVVIDGIAVSDQTKLGIPETDGGSYLLTLTENADFSLNRIYVGKFGTLDINEGVMDTQILMCDRGKANLNSGNLTVSTADWGVKNGGVLTVKYGGTLRIENGGTIFSTHDSPDPVVHNTWLGAGSAIDIRGGEIVFDGDFEDAIRYHISGDQFTAYGGDFYTGNGYAAPVVSYDSENDVTTVSDPFNIWTGNGDGVSWSDPANWSKGTLPYYNLDSSEYTCLGLDAQGDQAITIDSYAPAGKVWLGREEDPDGTYTINLEDGSNFYIYRMYIGSKGIFNLNGGTFNTFIGRLQDAVVNINAGEFVIRSYVWDLQDDTIVTLNGGILRIKNGDKKFSDYGENLESPNTLFDGIMDFCGGKLIMDGDCRVALQWHIDNGNIIAYSGANSDYELELVYDEFYNTTTLSAVNVVAASYLWPDDGMTLTVDERQTIQLNWQAGEQSGRLEGYNVYVCDPNDDGVFELESDPAVTYQGKTWLLSVAPGGVYQWRIDEVLEGGQVVSGEVSTVTIAENILDVYDIDYDGSAQPLDFQWIGCGDGISWGDSLNWHSEVDGKDVPGYIENTYATSRIDYTNIVVDKGAYVDHFWLGYDDLNQKLIISDFANAQMYRIYARWGASIEIGTGATFKTTHIESNGANIDVKGHLSIAGQYWSFRQEDGEGALRLLDGYMEIKTMPPSLPFDEGEVGNIDIYDGMIQFNGDQRSTVQQWVEDKHIIAYGASDANSIVDIYYNVDMDVTFATGRKDPNLANMPIPADLETEAAVDGGLSWITGNGATGDTLYLTKCLKADLDENDLVDIDDLSILAENYLDDSWLSVANADIRKDSQVNLADLAVMAMEWNNELVLEEIDSFTQDPNVPFSYSITLEPETEYVWRIDTVVADGVKPGNAWSFTTGSDPMAAYNEYPVDGDYNIVNGTVELAWEVDNAIDSCNVYFGSSYDAVAGADSSSNEYKVNTSSNTWSCPALTTGQRYFWRIDTLTGPTIRTGKVWSFKVTDIPMGLYVEGGVLKHNGSEFKCYGVNYMDAFTRTLDDHSDTSYQEGFAVLGQNGIPFARMCAGDFYVINWQLYFEDKEKYFQLMDGVIASAEENNVGLILDLFWKWFLVPDLVGEHVTDWANPESESCKFVEKYVREIYERYKNSPALFGWELGNEYNLYAETQDVAPVKLPIFGHPLVRDDTEDRLTMDLTRQIAANFANAVRKVDKNRMVTNGFSFNKENGVYVSPEIEDDHSMVDVASVHYYATGGSDFAMLSSAVSTTAGWGKPLFVGEFGVSEENPNNFTTVEAGFDQMLSELQTAGVTFASVWIFDAHPEPRDSVWNITDTNFRAYMLDKLSQANQALNQ